MSAYGLFWEQFQIPSCLLSLVVTSVVLTRWRTQLKRQMNERDIVSAMTVIHN